MCALLGTQKEKKMEIKKKEKKIIIDPQQQQAKYGSLVNKY